MNDHCRQRSFERTTRDDLIWGHSRMIGAKFRSMNAASLRASLALMFPAVFLSNIASAGASNHAMSEYRSTISPLLEKHCYECHGDGYDKGKIAFDALESD